jgi:L-amino acid N-acyltransferase YncA
VLTFQIDSFADSIPELRAIFPEHHRELGLFRDRMPLDPDFPEYVRREAAGELLLFTGRWNGKIAAYCTVHVRPGFHYRSTMTGTTDLVYVTPEYRDRGLILPLYRKVQEELRRRGVQIWFAGWKLHNPMGMPRLHEMLGFIPADQYVVKWLGAR